MPPDLSDHRKAPATWPTLRRFLPYLWPKDRPDLKTRIVVAGALILIAKAVQLSMGWLFGQAVDAMQPAVKGAGTVAFALVMAYIAARFFGVFFDQVRNYIFERVGQDAARRLAVRVFEHLHKLSLSFHLSRRTGAVTKIIDRGTKSIDTMLYFLLFNIGPTMLELVAVVLIFWFSFSPWLGLVTALAMLLYIWVTRTITEWRNALRTQMNQMDNQAVSRSVDSLLNYETVKYFGAEERETQRYAQSAAHYAEAAIKSENSLTYLNVTQALILNVTMAIAMGFTVWGWNRGMFKTGDLVFVNTLLLQLFRPLDMLGMVYRTLRQGVIDMGDMFQLIDTPQDVTDAPDAHMLAVTAGEVRFENVRFGYHQDRTVLSGLSFTAQAGKVTALVGPSGAGKSTIARLIFRFYDPQGGQILIDNQPITQVCQHSLRRAIGIVPQDTVLFNDTIGYNIGYGHPDGPDAASREEIEAAAKGAAIHAFISELPDGYDTQVGERGLKLSGGEKQRVAIARTLLKNPPILLFDEATSALDSRTEADIQQTLAQIEQGHTTLVIAHRLSTITHADNIIVLSDGKVAEEGTHSALLSKGGLYAELWARQAAQKAQEEVAAEV